MNNKDYLHQRLITLGDAMGDGLHYENPSIAKEYKQICKQLYPKMYPRKKPCYTNKPSKALKRTIKECSCGRKQFGWERKDNKVRLFCQCGYTTEFYDKNTYARDEWNRRLNEEKTSRI